jgi:hypothetical protein
MAAEALSWTGPPGTVCVIERSCILVAQDGRLGQTITVPTRLFTNAGETDWGATFLKALDG